MINFLTTSGFRGVPQRAFSVNRGGLCVLSGSSGSGKSAIYDAVRFVQQIARGATVPLQIVHPVPYWSSSQWSPLSVCIGFDAHGYSFTYEIQIQSALNRLLVVGNERLLYTFAGGNQCMAFERRGERISRESADRSQYVFYTIPPETFALSTIVVSSAADPIAIARNELAGFLLVRPNLMAISDAVLSPQWINDSFDNLSTCLAVAFQSMPAAYPKIENFCRQTIRGFEYLVVREQPSMGRFVYMRKNGIELPISALSTTEKAFLVASYVVAFGCLSGTGVCLWDDVLSGIPDDSREFVINALRQAYQSGQCIVTSSLAIGPFMPNEILNVNGRGRLTL